MAAIWFKPPPTKIMLMDAVGIRKPTKANSNSVFRAAEFFFNHLTHHCQYMTNIFI